MGAYLKICEGGTYSEKQYFVFFTAVLREVSVYIIAVPKKRSKFTTKAKEQLTMLAKEFEVSNYLNNKAIANLIKETGLTKP